MGWVLFALLLGWGLGVVMVYRVFGKEIAIGRMALCKDHLEIKINKGERLELFINENDTLYVRMIKEDCPK